MGHNHAGAISYVLSEQPTNHKQLVGVREILMLRFCHMYHNNLLTLIKTRKLTSLESLYRHKLRPQCLHFEDILTRSETVNPHPQGMNKTHPQPVPV